MPALDINTTRAIEQVAEAVPADRAEHESPSEMAPNELARWKRAGLTEVTVERPNASGIAEPHATTP